MIGFWASKWWAEILFSEYIEDIEGKDKKDTRFGQEESTDDRLLYAQTNYSVTDDGALSLSEEYGLYSSSNVIETSFGGSVVTNILEPSNLDSAAVRENSFKSGLLRTSGINVNYSQLYAVEHRHGSSFFPLSRKTDIYNLPLKFLEKSVDPSTNNTVSDNTDTPIGIIDDTPEDGDQDGGSTEGEDDVVSAVLTEAFDWDVANANPLAILQNYQTSHIDKDGYELLFIDNFNGNSNFMNSEYDFNMGDDTVSGLWNTYMKHMDRLANDPTSVYLGPDLSDELPNPFSMIDGKLVISASVLSDTQETMLKQAIIDENRKYNDPAEDLDYDFNYYSGAITTINSWAEPYGYYEISAKMPEGQGHWAAFWTAPSSEGRAVWPGEIDIYEILGRQNRDGTAQDNILNMTVHFDDYVERGVRYGDEDIDFTNNAYDNDPEIFLVRRNVFTNEFLDADRNPILNEDGNPITNLADISVPEGKRVLVEYNDESNNQYLGDSRYSYHQKLALKDIDPDIDIFENFYTYSLEWTPTEIIWYFGTDAENLIEVYRTETPEDLHTAQYLLTNNELGGPWAWAVSDTAVLENTYEVDYVAQYAREADSHITVNADDIYIYGDDKTLVLSENGLGGRDVALNGNDDITGNSRDNIIHSGTGLDYITGGAGADTFYIRYGDGNKIIRDFNPDQNDVVLLEGFNFENQQDFLNSIVQVGSDVWIIDGSRYDAPQTVILQNMTIYDLYEHNFERFTATQETVIFNEAITQNFVGNQIVGSDNSDRIFSNATYELVGGKGDDAYKIYASDVVIIENDNEGIDLVETSRSYTLGDNIENLLAFADGNITLRGNELDNRITGKDGNNIIEGMKGNDLLDLQGGSNTVIYNGGDGIDRIYGFDSDDTITLNGITFANDTDLLSRMVQTGRDVTLDMGYDGDGQAQKIIFSDNLVSDIDASQIQYEVGGFVNNSVAEQAAPKHLFYNSIQGTSDSDLLSGYDTADEFIFSYNHAVDGSRIIQDYITNFDSENGDFLNLTDIADGIYDAYSMNIQDALDDFIKISHEDEYTIVELDIDGVATQHDFAQFIVLDTHNIDLDVEAAFENGTIVI